MELIRYHAVPLIKAAVRNAGVDRALTKGPFEGGSAYTLEAVHPIHACPSVQTRTVGEFCFLFFSLKKNFFFNFSNVFFSALYLFPISFFSLLLLFFLLDYFYFIISFIIF